MTPVTQNIKRTIFSAHHTKVLPEALYKLYGNGLYLPQLRTGAAGQHPRHGARGYRGPTAARYAQAQQSGNVAALPAAAPLLPRRMGGRNVGGICRAVCAAGRRRRGAGNAAPQPVGTAVGQLQDMHSPARLAGARPAGDIGPDAGGGSPQ